MSCWTKHIVLVCGATPSGAAPSQRCVVLSFALLWVTEYFMLIECFVLVIWLSQRRSSPQSSHSLSTNNLNHPHVNRVPARKRAGPSQSWDPAVVETPPLHLCGCASKQNCQQHFFLFAGIDPEIRDCDANTKIEMVQPKAMTL